MKFIKLTRLNNEVIYIAIDDISQIVKTYGGNGSSILFKSPDVPTRDVKESPELVIGLIEHDTKSFNATGDNK